MPTLLSGHGRQQTALFWRQAALAMERKAEAHKFPDTEYDAVLCFSALQQMSRIQLETLLPRIREALRVFFGSVSLIPENTLMHTDDQVRAEPAPYFQSIELNCSPWPNGQVECYFRCHE
jgi:hypothetical protein